MRRRGLLLGLAGLITAPALVRAESLMKISAPKPWRTITGIDWAEGKDRSFTVTGWLLYGKVDGQFVAEWRDGLQPVDVVAAAREAIAAGRVRDKLPDYQTMLDAGPIGGEWCANGGIIGQETALTLSGPSRRLKETPPSIRFLLPPPIPADREPAPIRVGEVMRVVEVDLRPDVKEWKRVNLCDPLPELSAPKR